MSRKLISIVVPCYREEENIPLLYKRLYSITSSAQQYDWELILINDGSPDNTRLVIQEYCEKDSQIKGINLSRNFGHQAALTAGLNRSSGDYIVSMDADLQDSPEIVIQMIDQLEEGSDVVYARRTSRSDKFLKKHTALWYYKILGQISSTSIPRNVGDFRAVTRQVLDMFLSMNEQDRYIRGMFAWMGFKVSYVDFSRPERIHGETGYTWSKMIKLATDGILNFSMAPLQIGLWIGIAMIVLSMGFFLYIFWDAIVRNTDYPLYKWLSVLMFGFMGLQFIFLWIMGEYIGRIYNEARKRPLFIIKDTINL